VNRLLLAVSVASLLLAATSLGGLVWVLADPGYWLNVQGEKGEQGAPGERGPRGSVGASGLPGEAGLGAQDLQGDMDDFEARLSEAESSVASLEGQLVDFEGQLASVCGRDVVIGWSPYSYGNSYRLQTDTLC
jgi:hypothetical protein